MATMYTLTLSCLLRYCLDTGMSPFFTVVLLLVSTPDSGSVKQPIGKEE